MAIFTVPVIDPVSVNFKSDVISLNVPECSFPGPNPLNPIVTFALSICCVLVIRWLGLNSLPCEVSDNEKPDDYKNCFLHIVLFVYLLIII